LVGAVAERFDRGAPAAAQRDGCATRVDDLAILREERERAAQQQRTVLADGDGDHRIFHADGVPAHPTGKRGRSGPYAWPGVPGCASMYRTRVHPSSRPTANASL